MVVYSVMNIGMPSSYKQLVQEQAKNTYVYPVKIASMEVTKHGFDPMTATKSSLFAISWLPLSECIT